MDGLTMPTRFPQDHYEGVYQRGIAVGAPSIQNDEITFRFKKELFTFPSVDVIGVCRYNGIFYEARIDDLRKLAKAKH